MPSADPAIDRHLDAWLGASPPLDGGVVVVGSERRVRPGWDGTVQPLFGVLTPTAAVLSVAPTALDAVTAAVAGRDVGQLVDVRASIAAAIGRPGGRVIHGVFRWSSHPTPMPEAGVWVPVDHPLVPPWLVPFGGEVLLALDGGRHIAGVGLKRHDPTGQEVAVVTEAQARGRGLGRRLVSQAARRVTETGAVVTYLHAPDNAASAHVADAAGFPDVGWRCLAIFGG